MKCPVCPLAEVPEDAVRCPGCGTDLAAFRHLHELGAKLFNDALALASQGDLEAALEKVRAAMVVDGRPARARTLAGKLLWKIGRLEEAINEWNRAVAEAPDDGELARLVAAGRAQRERRHHKQRTLRILNRLLAVAATILLAAASAWMVIEVTSGQREILSDRVAGLERALAAAQQERTALQNRLDDATAQAAGAAAALEDYRHTHRHSDEDFQVALARAESAASQVHREAEAGALLCRELERERTRLREAEQRCVELAVQALGADRRAADSAQQARQARQALHGREAWVRESLVPLLAAMRPRQADGLKQLIDEFRDEVATLQRKVSELRSRPIFLVTDLRLAGIREKMNLASMQLTLAETQYRDCVAPWEQVMARVRAAVTSWEREASP